MTQGTAQRTIMVATSKPMLPRHMKLRHDATRATWTILGPERVFTPDAIALAVLRHCDGLHTIDDIALALSRTHNAPKERILADITSLLQELADKGVVKA